MLAFKKNLVVCLFYFIVKSFIYFIFLFVISFQKLTSLFSYFSNAFLILVNKYRTRVGIRNAKTCIFQKVLFTQSRQDFIFTHPAFCGKSDFSSALKLWNPIWRMEKIVMVLITKHFIKIVYIKMLLYIYVYIYIYIYIYCIQNLRTRS